MQLKSWTTDLYVDVIVVDQEAGKVASCPDSHPTELITNVWPGTTHVCDCLERKYDKWLFPDMVCVRKGKNPPHREKECVDIEAIPPVVQSVVNGMKVCAKTAPGMNFASAVRPTGSS